MNVPLISPPTLKVLECKIQNLELFWIWGRECCPEDHAYKAATYLGAQKALYELDILDVFRVILPLISKNLSEPYDNCQYNSDLQQVWELT